MRSRVVLSTFEMEFGDLADRRDLPDFDYCSPSGTLLPTWWSTR
jgi:hypothetical protein